MSKKFQNHSTLLKAMIAWYWISVNEDIRQASDGMLWSGVKRVLFAVAAAAGHREFAPGPTVCN